MQFNNEDVALKVYNEYAWASVLGFVAPSTAARGDVKKCS
jgi:hypothetical protein